MLYAAAVRNKPWTGFAFASRTDVRRPSSGGATVATTAAGPVAHKQVRFPSVKYGENVKLDQQTQRPDFGSPAAVGPFGLGLVIGDAGLRFVGVAEAAIMWHSVPAEVVLDLAGNSYEWDVIAKKVNVPAQHNNRVHHRS